MEKTKDKDTYVVERHKDRNGKEHFTVYETKTFTNSDTQKQFVIFVEKNY